MNEQSTHDAQNFAPLSTMSLPRSSFRPRLRCCRRLTRTALAGTLLGVPAGPKTCHFLRTGASHVKVVGH